jgi:hypothetical protein
MHTPGFKISPGLYIVYLPKATFGFIVKYGVVWKAAPYFYSNPEYYITIAQRIGE